MPDALRLALIASTCAPYARDAGRADVVAALADAVARRGHDVTLFLPAHRDLAIPADAIRETLLAGYPVPMGEANEPASLIRITRPGQPFEVLLVQHRGAGRWFDRPGFAPADDARAPREAFFARAALEGLRRLDRRVDLVHAFDAPAAWAPAYLRRAYAGDGFFARTGCLFSVLDWSDAPTEPAPTVGALGLGADAEDPWSRFTGRDGVPVLALALRHADRIVFPSTRFAVEVREDRELAGPHSAVLAARAKDLLGVVPGIDARQWDPAGDLAIAARYSAPAPAGKEACRAALAERCGWPHDPAERGWQRPIVGLIAQLSDEKGLAVVREALDGLLALDVRLAVLGRGDSAYETMFTEAAQRDPDHLHAWLDFDDAQARRILAGADLLLVPSRREAGGMQQLRALRYGTIPVAHATGGLVDSLREFDADTLEGTAFLFRPHGGAALLEAVGRAVSVHAEPHRWARLVRNALTTDVSWEATAAGYEDAYRAVRRHVEARRFSSWALGIARS
jgi:starch synthase